MTPSHIQASRKSRLVYGEKLVRLLELNVDFLPVVRTAVIDLGMPTPDRALYALDAFLQWFSVIPMSRRIEHYVMLRGDVDQMWHSMILNTALYRNICTRYIGRFIDHYSNLGCPRASWVLDTVGLLAAEFRTALHPIFLEWRAAAVRGHGDPRPEEFATLSDWPHAVPAAPAGIPCAEVAPGLSP
jgi:hypothetical protein